MSHICTPFQHIKHSFFHQKPIASMDPFGSQPRKARGRNCRIQYKIHQTTCCCFQPSPSASTASSPPQVATSKLGRIWEMISSCRFQALTRAGSAGAWEDSGNACPSWQTWTGLSQEGTWPTSIYISTRGLKQHVYISEQLLQDP